MLSKLSCLEADSLSKPDAVSVGVLGLAGAASNSELNISYSQTTLIHQQTLHTARNAFNDSHENEVAIVLDLPLDSHSSNIISSSVIDESEPRQALIGSADADGFMMSL